MLVTLCVAAYASCALAQSSSASIAATTNAAAATTTFPLYHAKTATTISRNTLPSGLSVTATREAPQYTASRFPYKQFWPGGNPGQTNVEVQPKVVNPLTNVTFEADLTNPETVPHFDLRDDAWFFPSTNQTLYDPSAVVLTPGYNISLLSTPASRALALDIQSQIVALINATNKSDSSAACATCQAALKLGQTLSQQAPWEAVQVMISLCELYKYQTSPLATCSEVYSASNYGSIYTQVLANAVFGYGYDAQWLCYSQLSYCKAPGVTDYFPTASDLLPTPKPADYSAPEVKPGTPRLKVVHISDLHLDPRYAIGSEANCSAYLCCRAESTNKALRTTNANASLPAPRYGSFDCDSPFDLVTSTFQAIPDLMSLGEKGPDFTIFTGDIVSHDNANELDSPYAFYEESVIYTMFKNYLTGANGSAPVYPTISNHDGRYGGGYNIPNVFMPPYLRTLYQEDYNQLIGLWQQYGWIDAEAAQTGRNHYASYSVVTPQGLRIISFNANFYYTGNIWNYVNTSSADNSGIFAWLADELQAAEDNNERVWVLVHEPGGYDGQASLPNPSDLFAQIIARYSPRTIAAVFGGHNHEDETFTTYDGNGTMVSAEGALVQTWLAGSVTPLTNQNPRVRFYEIDSETFDVLDVYNYYTDVQTNNNASLAVGIDWEFAYSTRQTYGANISWPDYAPLNATWWYYVTQQMGYQPSLVETFQLYQSGLSIQTPNCTSSACVNAKICYLQSGSKAQSGAGGPSILMWERY